MNFSFISVVSEGAIFKYFNIYFNNIKLMKNRQEQKWFMDPKKREYGINILQRMHDAMKRFHLRHVFPFSDKVLGNMLRVLEDYNKVSIVLMLI